VLDGAQAGLSWKTILHRREWYRRAFDDFDPEKIAQYDDAKVAELMQDSSIIRNRLKITWAIKNAWAFLTIQKEFWTFDAYIWSFVWWKTIINTLHERKDFMATSPESDAMSRDMKNRWFTFVGSTICYAFMQAAGLVNDHMVGCFRKNISH
jgi:DNA-3-methyladenine glycosylase I